MQNIQKIYTETKQLLQLYRQKLSVPRTLSIRQQIRRYPWIPSFVTSLQKNFKTIQIGALTFREQQKSAEVLQASFKHLHLFCKSALRIQAGRENIVFPEWLRNTPKKTRLKFLQEYLLGIKHWDNASKALLMEWMEQGLKMYQKDLARLKKLKQKTAITARADYDNLVDIRNALLGCARLLGYKKSVLREVLRNK